MRYCRRALAASGCHIRILGNIQRSCEHSRGAPSSWRSHSSLPMGHIQLPPLLPHLGLSWVCPLPANPTVPSPAQTLLRPGPQWASASAQGSGQSPGVGSLVGVGGCLLCCSPAARPRVSSSASLSLTCRGSRAAASPASGNVQQHPGPSRAQPSAGPGCLTLLHPRSTQQPQGSSQSPRLPMSFPS